MPQIAEYSAGSQEAAPATNANAVSERASGVLTGAANALTTTGTAVTAHEERVDATNLAVQHSQIAADHSVEWDGMVKSGDAADPDKVQAFNDKYKEQFDALPEGMKTTHGIAAATAQGASSAAQLQAKTLIESSQAQGEQAVQGNKIAINNYSNAARLDPASVAGHVMDYESGVDAIKSLDPKQKAAIKLSGGSEILRGAVDGLVDQKNFDGARELLASDQVSKYVDATQQYQMGLKIDQREHSQEVAARIAEEQKQKAAKEASSAAANDYTKQFGHQDAQTLVDAINNDDRLTLADKGEITRLMEVNHSIQTAPERAAREAASAGREAQNAAHAAQEHALTESNRKASLEIVRRMDLPFGDPERIAPGAEGEKQIRAEAKADGTGLNVTSMNSLISSQKTRDDSIAKGDGIASQMTNFRALSKAERDPSNTTRGKINYENWLNYTEPKIREGLQKGIPFGDLTDKEGKDYIGKGYIDPSKSIDTYEDKGGATTNPVKAPPFTASSLDKIPKGAPGSTAGIAALNAAVKAGSISPQAATREVDTRGWRPGAK